MVADYEGSISAEHGLGKLALIIFLVSVATGADCPGVMKAPHVHYSKSPESIDLMRKIKHLFDPKGLMNPYKYIT
jgi:FAD/FMN-containing dehydrogenase